MIEVQLTQGQVAIIDDEDSWVLELGSWQALPEWHKGKKTGKYYAVHRDRQGDGGKQRSLLLHRAIMQEQLSGDLEVDHVNGNRLDCRRSNLRVATRSQNACNRNVQSNSLSGVKGVCWDKSRSKWKAQLTIGGKHFQIGRFDTLDEAIEAYEEYSKIYHKEFARKEK